jgi:hypothetical protein
VNAYEQLVAIRERLERNGANEASIELIDKFLTRAESERESQTSVPMAMMLKHLLRQRETLGNDSIYNDLQELIDDEHVPPRRDPDSQPYAWEEERRPKPHSYYKQLKKEREQQQGK